MNARYSLTLFAVLLMFTVCTAQKVKAPIGKATVFLNGAEISRTAEVKLKAGKSTLVFSEISANIRSESIRVSVGQDVTILSVSDRRNYLHAQQRSKSITTLSDSLAKTRDEVALTDGQIATLRSEKELLFREEAIGGVSSGVPVEEIERRQTSFVVVVMKFMRNYSVWKRLTTAVSAPSKRWKGNWRAGTLRTCRRWQKS